MIHPNSLPVAATLWVLIGFSVATWALILIKAVQHVRIARGNRDYSKQFWEAANLQAASEIKDIDAPVSQVAAAGFRALATTHLGTTEFDLEHSWDRHESLERNLRQQVQREKRRLEAGLAVLATVGSTAPFVGLFGTVWGIMSAMREISRVGNASIDVVAGPIGEALIATGIGIAVAIPAVLAYNYFLRRLKAVVADLDDFAHDFLNLSQRATYRIERHGKTHESRGTHRGRDFDRPQSVIGSKSVQYS
jgi:biopolymer transport protein ExbB